LISRDLEQIAPSPFFVSLSNLTQI